MLKKVTIPTQYIFDMSNPVYANMKMVEVINVIIRTTRIFLKIK